MTSRFGIAIAALGAGLASVGEAAAVGAAQARAFGSRYFNRGGTPAKRSRSRPGEGRRDRPHNTPYLSKPNRDNRTGPLDYGKPKSKSTRKRITRDAAKAVLRINEKANRRSMLGQSKTVSRGEFVFFKRVNPVVEYPSDIQAQRLRAFTRNDLRNARKAKA